MYGTPLNFVACLLFHAEAMSERLSGTVSQPQRIPVKPAFFDSEPTSTAHSDAFFTEKTERGMPSPEKAEYAASNTISDPVESAKFTHFSSPSAVYAAPVGFPGEQRYITYLPPSSGGDGRKPFSRFPGRKTASLPLISQESGITG